MREVFRICDVHGLRIIVCTAERDQVVVRIADSDEDFKEVWLQQHKAGLLLEALTEVTNRA
jgi:hypothetical protein